MSKDPRSFADSLLDIAVTVLAACLGLYVAVKLLVSILPVLLISIGVLGCIWLGRALQRRDRW